MHEPTPSSKLELARALAPCTEPQRCASVERRSLRLKKALTSLIPTAQKKLVARCTHPSVQPTFLNATRATARCPSLDAPFETQLERVVREILRRTKINEVVFTIVDQAYGDLLEANFEMAQKAGFSDGLFYVSLDRHYRRGCCKKRESRSSRNRGQATTKGRGLSRQVLRRHAPLQGENPVLLLGDGPVAASSTVRTVGRG